MKEFGDHLEFYSTHWFMHFSKDIPETIWGDKILAKSYLTKYWLPFTEHQKIWMPMLENIFSNKIGLPYLMFRDTYNMIASSGGCLFLEQDFLQLQKCMLELNEEYFVVIENTFHGIENEPPFYMKFPVKITWDELMSGNYISAVIFETNYKEFFVFSKSNLWGKYAASDYDQPLDLIGFKPECEKIFRKEFVQSEEERSQVIDLLPREYIPFIKR